MASHIEKIAEILEFGVTEVYTKADRIRDYREEASRLSSMANKRIQRLEKANLTDSPAYKRFIRDGGARFGVRGKSFNEVQAEVSRLQKFLDSDTSTIKGVNNVLTEMAKNTGIKYKDLSELRQKAPKFFELSSKVEQYLRNVTDAASAIGYQAIWEAVNDYVEEQELDLGGSIDDIDLMIERVSKALTEYDTPVRLPHSGEWFSLKE